jgi:D-ribulokinase
MRPPHPPLFVGIDLGTSGCRAAAIDAAGERHAGAAVSLAAPLGEGAASEQDPRLWWEAACEVLARLFAQVPAAAVRAIAVDGTSGTLLATDAAGNPLGPALMYDDARAREAAERIAAVAPAGCAAHGASSALAKLLYLQESGLPPATRHVLHQADWIAGRLAGRYSFSDEHNCLKLGYDVQARRWPAWLARLGVRTELLPRVLVPGAPLGGIDRALASVWGLAEDCRVVAGTTDSTAAFLASGAREPGEAVTSLGSTLVLKVISERPVFSPAHGVYSHRLGNRWLAGGASNSGGAVLLQHFSREELGRLTPLLRPDSPTALDYYPLPAPGERFPVSDPTLPPRTEPRPADDGRFLQGLLEGIAAVERRGYELLAELGAPYPSSLRTVGGGARNPAWSRIRARLLGVPLLPPTSEDAAYGAALLARR